LGGPDAVLCRIRRLSEARATKGLGGYRVQAHCIRVHRRVGGARKIAGAQGESVALINPLHPDAKRMTAKVVRRFEYDRLFRRA